MHAMFELGMEWWEFVVRAVAVYVVVLLLTRMSGKRSMGQSTPFDILVIVLLGTAVQNSLIGEDTSLPGGLILAATLISCVQVLLQAFALPLHQQLGIYLALICVQCVLLEHSGFFDPGQNKARLQLFGLFGALLIILGLLRPITGTTLMPVGFILLGLLLAGFQAWTHYSKLR